MKSLMAFLGRHKGQTVLSVIAAAATILAGIGLMTHSSYLLSRAALRPPILDLMLVIVGVRFFALSRAACRYVERLISHDLTFKWLSELRVRLYTCLLPHMPGLRLRSRSGEVLGTMVSDIDTLQQFYLRVVAPVVTALLVTVVSVAGLHLFSPLLAWTTLIFLALNGMAVPWFIRRRTRGLGALQVNVRGRLHAELVEQWQGVTDVLLFGREEEVAGTIAALDEELARTQRRQAVWTGAQDALAHYCAQFGMWTVLALAVPMVGDGRLGGVWLAALTLGVLTAFEAVQSLGVAFQFHEQTRVAAERLENLAPPVECRTESNPVPVAQQDFDIRFERVSFSYPGGFQLHDISFSLDAGHRVAVVGPSGAGKSTLAHLLLRFHDPDSGRIALGGCDLSRIPREEVWRQVGVIPQSVHLFNESIRYNLLLARTDATEDQLWHALEQVHLADFVHSLPDGLDTMTGEQGAQLSGGERQRIAVARAVLQDAPVMIIDEPTTHLDARNERGLLDLLLAVTANRSALWITHRLLQMKAMHLILVMEDGRIREQGSHEALLARNGYYAHMIRLQNQMLV